ncbi:protein IQ-DOMAIN 19-like [Arachis hypogaea]|uniref:protein IQ-DOMAIN 19-like n=1 Tax=Arachis hypogaea TaxID=3818 RepID=UPI003B21991E
MGKAGKWIRNFLMGKKEDKYKKIDAVCAESKRAAADSPKVKRRWSFGRLTIGRTSGKMAGHKFSISFDSGDSAKLQAQTPRRSLPIVEFKAPSDTRSKNSAATMIQAAFRSYLARKALHALKGLVKIQALVRGHLVRKQTTAMLRSMHALMTIQVRARIQRIQTVEEANVHGKQPVQHTQIPQRKGHIKEYKVSLYKLFEPKDMTMEEMLEALKSRSQSLDRSHFEGIKHESMAFYSKHKSVSERQFEYNDNSLITAPNSPENYCGLSEYNTTAMAMSTPRRHPVSHRQSQSPNFMNNTVSSKAKARSQSEPKQRPKWGKRQKSRSPESTKEPSTSQNGLRQNLHLNSSHIDLGSLDYWVVNLYGSTTKDSSRNSFGSSTVTSDSYY